MSEPDGDRQRWLRGVLERFEQPLVRYARRLTGDLDRARDVVQDTFIRLCTQDRAHLDGRLAEWLYTVALPPAARTPERGRLLRLLLSGGVSNLAVSELIPYYERMALFDRDLTHAPYRCNVVQVDAL